MAVHEKFPQVTHQELATQIRKFDWTERIGGVLLILLSVGFAIRWGTWVVQTKAPVSPIIWFSFVFFFLYGLYRQIASLEIPQGVLLEKANPTLLGPYSPDRLHTIVREVCETYYEREIPNIYIVETSSEALAAVVRVSFLGFVRRWNAIYIGPYLLQALDEQELRAVLGHEMAHFYVYPTFWTRFFYLKLLLFGIWMTPLYFYVSEFIFGRTSGNGRSWGQYLLFFVLIWGWDFVRLLVGLFIHLWTYRPDQQEMEALCDFEAAKRYGQLSMINALLKMGTRQEIFTMLVAQFSPDPHRPTSWHLSALQDQNANSADAASSPSREIPTTTEAPSHQKSLDLDSQKQAMATAYLYLNEHLPHHFLTVEESLPYIEQAIQEGMKNTKARRFRHRTRRVLNWLQYDTHIVNQKLERVEYEAFLAELRRNPNQPLFYIEEELNEEQAKDAEHPTFRNRILFLEFNYRKIQQ